MMMNVQPLGVLAAQRAEREAKEKEYADELAERVASIPNISRALAQAEERVANAREELGECKT